jgi:N-acetylmuramoyl-L-alanine amidase
MLVDTNDGDRNVLLSPQVRDSVARGIADVVIAHLQAGQGNRSGEC